MKKAEMEAHEARYQALMSEARAAEREGMYRHAVKLALACWEHIDGMMQYQRKYAQQTFASIPAIEMILRYAPLLMDFESLDSLEKLLKDCRRIERDTSVSLAEKLADARSRMWEHHRLWDHLEQSPNARQDELRQVLGGDQDQWRSVAEAWEKMRLLRRTPAGGSYRLALSTRLAEVLPAKCPSCGDIVEGPKAMFVEEMACPECGASVLFVILPPQPVAQDKE